MITWKGWRGAAWGWLQFGVMWSGKARLEEGVTLHSGSGRREPLRWELARGRGVVQSAMEATELEQSDQGVVGDQVRGRGRCLCRA